MQKWWAVWKEARVGLDEAAAARKKEDHKHQIQNGGKERRRVFLSAWCFHFPFPHLGYSLHGAAFSLLRS